MTSNWNAPFFDHYADSLNPRQEKVLRRMLQEGPEGFEEVQNSFVTNSPANMSPQLIFHDRQ